jgi:hypothetical protein
MDNIRDGDYPYSIEAGSAGAGRRVWRWTVRRRGGGKPAAQGTSIRSHEDAKTAALEAIRQLQQRGNAA